jgi:glycosyltransferase involved in cell wall biosynthesis
VRIALIADAYPPLRTSTAVQIRDLAQEFALQGHDISVLVPCAERSKPWIIETMSGVQVLRLPAAPTKDIGYVRRTINEMLLSFAMWRGIRQSPLRSVQWEAVVWYSPSIFLGPLVGALKRSTECRTYLVLRDIFPEWAVDMRLLSKGLIYRFFKLVERYQYSVADVIGVQSPSNLGYLAAWARKPGRRLQVLHNWLAAVGNVGSSISIDETPLAGRTIFVYVGNMGVAQGMDIILELADRLKSRRDIGFLFVGRGSEVPRLKALAARRALDNVKFSEEVDPSEISGLLSQCHIGIVALDPRHKTHNVPGKFLAYMQAGLPVLARVNAGNDLAELIEKQYVGCAYIGESADSLAVLAERLCDEKSAREEMSLNARSLVQCSFSVTAAVKQILAALSKT